MSFLDSISTGRFNLRSEEEERQTLEKANFDLKMKVFHLESNIRRLTNGDSFNSENMDIISLTNEVDQKNSELEHRNSLLVKAKSAIENLKEELAKHREIEKDRQDEVDQRVNMIKKSYEEVESRYRIQFSELENQLLEARMMLATKDHLQAESDERLVSPTLCLLSSTYYIDVASLIESLRFCEYSSSLTLNCHLCVCASYYSDATSTRHVQYGIAIRRHQSGE
jgi:ribosomal protein L31E